MIGLTVEEFPTVPCRKLIKLKVFLFQKIMKGAMRRCGQNPTDVEVSDIINKIHDDTGSLDLDVSNLGTKTHYNYINIWNW